jgi:hypothetical protein
MARDGRLLALSYGSQLKAARLQARLGAALRTAPTRQHVAAAAEDRLRRRLEELERAEDLAGCLYDRTGRRAGASCALPASWP